MSGVMICYITITISGDLFVGWFIGWCYGLMLLLCDCLGVGFVIVGYSRVDLCLLFIVFGCCLLLFGVLDLVGLGFVCWLF